jgi:hypothetical protein
MLTERDNRWLKVMGRLKAGIGFEPVKMAMAVPAQQLAQQYPKTNENITVALYPEQNARAEPEAAGTNLAHKPNKTISRGPKRCVHTLCARSLLK